MRLLYGFLVILITFSLNVNARFHFHKSRKNNNEHDPPPIPEPPEVSSEPPTVSQAPPVLDPPAQPPEVSSEPPTVSQAPPVLDPPAQPPEVSSEPPSISQAPPVLDPPAQSPEVSLEPPTVSQAPPVLDPPAQPPEVSLEPPTVSQAPVLDPPAQPPEVSSESPIISQPTLPHVPSDPAFPPAPDKDCVFDVTSYGAVGDGSTDDTAAFRAAWKDACAVESATILAPSDYTFTITSTIFSGPCMPGLVFQLDGVLMPPNGPGCWPKSDSIRQWLVFYRLDDMTFAGEGTIEGNGEKWWDLPCKPHKGPHGSTLRGPCDSPSLIRFFMSSNLVVSGLTIQNSPQFHMKFDGCEGVLIENLLISSPKLSPNTDGIHIENTKSVGIYDSKIGNGDDCISIGTGCADVLIEGVTCGPSHGISIGSLGVHNSEACVSNITVRNVNLIESDNGLRIKTWQGGTGSVTGVSFENIEMENVRNCVIIDQYYCLSKDCRNETSAVYVSDVSYKNIKGTYDVRSPPIHFACSDTIACTNITMSEVELLPEEGEVVDDPFCWNAYGNQETLTIPPVTCLQDGEPESLAEISNYACKTQ